MPQLIFSAAATKDLKRIRQFLHTKDNEAAQRVGKTIARSLQQLAQLPESGRPVENMELEFREQIIGFGSTGYVALYRYDGFGPVVVLAIRHQKEAGFELDMLSKNFTE
ncbi:type II toxin-antitoxin system RelE/ParE family toxin [Desulfovibrio sp. JC010]|uniref:type II toxin-antitoxin system RelE/ParE family toxin n=1 Tax=Desulfovibrio sp. JC010 TaxID=2593641 RepID=UPI0013D7B79D|nr:type II toxin-antitoxin system RelE/ParE family toxin [Desulfovibrio sp. JC010]NDV26779.1 type II toxin-antitoxin system RelE/ParE family toxin [Desulfovibrio sp. JC010]